jgi:transcriptional regulator with XRE-family HTH domain
MISGAQARAARAILRWTVADVAQRSDVAPNTVTRVEADKSVNTTTLKALQAAYEAGGIVFRDGTCVCAPTDKAGEA